MQFGLLFTLLICRFSLPIAAVSENGNAAIRLKNDLLSGYNKEFRSVQHHSNATIVYFSLALLAFRYDEYASKLTLTVWPELQWDDYYLQWQPRNYGNITTILIPSGKIWKPDITVYNSHGYNEIDPYGDIAARVYSNGTLKWIPRALFQVYCTPNVRLWPFDTQKCKLLMGSWMHTNDILDVYLKNPSVHLEQLETNSEWSMDKADGLRTLSDYTDAPPVELRFTFTLRRNYATYVTTVVGPAIGSVVMILLVFWIPPKSPERLYLNLLNILVCVGFMQYLGRILPNNGDETPNILLFFRDSLLMVTLSIAITVIFRRIESFRLEKPLPNVLTGGWLNKVLCIPKKFEAESQEGGTLLEESAPVTNMEIILILFDRILFLVYFLTFVIFITAFL